MALLHGGWLPTSALLPGSRPVPAACSFQAHAALTLQPKPSCKPPWSPLPPYLIACRSLAQLTALSLADCLLDFLPGQISALRQLRCLDVSGSEYLQAQ